MDAIEQGQHRGVPRARLGHLPHGSPRCHHRHAYSLQKASPTIGHVNTIFSCVVQSDGNAESKAKGTKSLEIPFGNLHPHFKCATGSSFWLTGLGLEEEIQSQFVVFRMISCNKVIRQNWRFLVKEDGTTSLIWRLTEHCY